MVKKFVIYITIMILLSFNAYSETQQEKILRLNDPSKIKDCHEGLNRAVFAINKGLDNVLFEPVAKAYRILPNPVRNGVSNSLDNLSNLVTIPNNILQGEFAKAGSNTGRFVINTTIGILGFIDVAEKIGFEEYEDLYISPPTQIEQVNSYKWLTGPKISFSLPQRKLLGNGDKWFNDIYLSYNLSYDHGKETFVKNSCIDNDLDGNCDTEIDDDLTSNKIIWSANDEVDVVKGGAKNIKFVKQH